jgi:GTP-binding protein LepA
MMSTKAHHELLEVGVISPKPSPARAWASARSATSSPVSRTSVRAASATRSPTPPSRPPPPWVATVTPTRWSSPGSTRSTATTSRICATPSRSSSSTMPRSPTSRRPPAALGFGFRCGFLGLLHLEIVRERLEREFNLDLISTQPNVVYDVTMEDGKEITVTNPSEFPGGKIAEVREPVVRATILAPSEFIGAIMELCQSSARLAARHGLPLRGPRRDPLHPAAGRDRLRLLRRS